MTLDTPVYALTVARELIGAGIPIFSAPPHVKPDCPVAHCREGLDSKMEFHLPPSWQLATPDMNVIEAWRPGDALCAVMGHGVDVIDVDPRNGGDASYEALCAAGLMPTAYGTARTPSGGVHFFVAGLHAAKGHAGVGIDVQAGADDGTGRGFVYIAPTVRVAKAGPEDGKPTPYEWTQRPDFSDMEGDDTGVALGEILRDARRPPPTLVGVSDPDDPFDLPDNSLSPDDAKRIYLPALAKYRNMGMNDHGFNAALNTTAMILGHFVPDFFSYDKAVEVLYEASVHNLSLDYQSPSGLKSTIDSGLTAGMREPRRRREASDDADQEGSPEGPDAADQLIGEMMTMAQLRQLPKLEPLINGVLDLNTIAWIIGKSGSYKSFVLLDMLCHIAAGKPWQGHAVRQGLCVYIVGEGVAGTSLRASAWESLYGVGLVGDQLLILPRPVQAKDVEAWAVLVEACRRLGPVAVAVDTQARSTIGLDENDNSQMMIYVNAADAIKAATKACVLTVHHIGRQGTDARGASSIDGAQDAELRIERTADRRVSLHMDKQKDADDSAVIELELARVEQGTDPDTGRDLSSLVVVTAGTLPVPPKVRDFIDSLAGNQAIVAGVIADHFPKLGGTKAEIKAVLRERFAEFGLPRMMPDGSWQRAWDALHASGVVVKIKGTQRYGLLSMLGKSDIDEG